MPSSFYPLKKGKDKKKKLYEKKRFKITSHKKCLCARKSEVDAAFMIHRETKKPVWLFNQNIKSLSEAYMLDRNDGRLVQSFFLMCIYIFFFLRSQDIYKCFRALTSDGMAQSNLSHQQRCRNLTTEFLLLYVSWYSLHQTPCRWWTCMAPPYHHFCWAWWGSAGNLSIRGSWVNSIFHSLIFLFPLFIKV